MGNFKLVQILCHPSQELSFGLHCHQEWLVQSALVHSGIKFTLLTSPMLNPAPWAIPLVSSSNLEGVNSIVLA